MSTQPGGPPNKWSEKIKTDGFTSRDFLDLLNDEAKRGNTNVVVKKCTDGEFTFFGNYE